MTRRELSLGLFAVLATAGAGTACLSSGKRRGRRRSRRRTRRRTNRRDDRRDDRQGKRQDKGQGGGDGSTQLSPSGPALLP